MKLRHAAALASRVITFFVMALGWFVLVVGVLAFIVGLYLLIHYQKFGP